MKDDYGRIPRVDRSFVPGDKVLQIFPLSILKGPRRKWAQMWTGPYIIHKRLNVTSYLLSKDGVVRRCPVHIDRLKRFVDDDAKHHDDVTDDGCA